MNRLPMPFNNPTTYPGHQGVDYGQKLGTPIPASGPGVISKRTYTQNGGNKVWVDYDAFPPGCDVGYAHLDNYTNSPPVGTRVAEGTTIALVGNTGLSTGPHLHSEVDGHFTTEGYWQFFDPNRVVASHVEGNQRVAGAYGAKARQDPSTNNPAVEDKFLEPGTIGTFNGWIRGQVVEGNDVWFRGAYSGLWFWSGGFSDKGTHDLEDLNSPDILPNQRIAAADTKARKDPSTAQAPVEDKYIKAGDVGTFDGWIRGENVSGNNVWFHGAFSGLWFWSGGFTDTGTHDLADLNAPPVPEPDRQRTVAQPGPSNVRALPYRSSPALFSEPGGVMIEMNAWTRGEAVEGNNIWFRRGDDQNWMWSGGFTSQSIADLPELPTPPEPVPPSDHNPMGLPEYEPVFPGAVIGLEAPLGFENCQVGGTRAKRTEKGVPPNVEKTSGVISLFIIHWTGVLGDQTAYFSQCNDRGSCPTTYVNAAGETLEMIRPGAKPAATGSNWNWRSWAVEIQMLDGNATDAQLDAVVEQMVFLREHHDSTLDGAPVDFLLDREHVIGDRDTRATSCPGDYIYSKIPWMIEEAQRRYDERHPAPQPDTYTVPVELGNQIRALVNEAFPES